MTVNDTACNATDHSDEAVDVRRDQRRPWSCWDIDQELGGLLER